MRTKGFAETVLLVTKHESLKNGGNPKRYRESFIHSEKSGSLDRLRR